MSAEPSYNAKFYAELWNLTERRIQQLAKEGIVVRAGRGKYYLLQSIKGYVTFLQTQLEGSADVIDFRVERARRERAQAEKTEMEVAVAKQQYVHVSHVEHALERFANTAAARLDSVGARLKQRHPTLTIRQIDAIKKEIAGARNEIASVRAFTP